MSLEAVSAHLTRANSFGKIATERETTMSNEEQVQIRLCKCGHRKEDHLREAVIGKIYGCEHCDTCFTYSPAYGMSEVVSGGISRVPVSIVSLATAYVGACDELKAAEEALEAAKEAVDWKKNAKLLAEDDLGDYVDEKGGDPRSVTVGKRSVIIWPGAPLHFVLVDTDQ